MFLIITIITIILSLCIKQVDVITKRIDDSEYPCPRYVNRKGEFDINNREMALVSYTSTTCAMTRFQWPCNGSEISFSFSSQRKQSCMTGDILAAATQREDLRLRKISNSVQLISFHDRKYWFSTEDV